MRQVKLEMGNYATGMVIVYVLFRY